MSLLLAEIILITLCIMLGAVCYGTGIDKNMSKVGQFGMWLCMVASLAVDMFLAYLSTLTSHASTLLCVWPLELYAVVVYTIVFIRHAMKKQQTAQVAPQIPPPQKVWREVGFDHAPVPGGHTSYMLVSGEMPGTVIPFPETNFLLTTPEHQQEIREEVKRLGFVLQLGAA